MSLGAPADLTVDICRGGDRLLQNTVEYGHQTIQRKWLRAQQLVVRLGGGGGGGGGGVVMALIGRSERFEPFLFAETTSLIFVHVFVSAANQRRQITYNGCLHTSCERISAATYTYMYIDVWV